MKQVPSLLLAATLTLTLAACGGGADEPVPSPASTPIPTAVPTAPPVTVDELVTLTDLGRGIAVPQVMLDSSYAREINAELMDIYTEYSQTDAQGGYLYPQQRGWAVNGRVLSLWDCWSFDGGSTEYKVFNLDARTGRQLTPQEVVSAAGMDWDIYSAALKRGLCSLYVDYSTLDEQARNEWNSMGLLQMGKGISQHTADQCIPFLQENGQLQVAATQYVMAGPDSVEVMFPLVPDLVLPGTLTSETDSQGRLVSETYAESHSRVTVRYSYKADGVTCQEILSPGGLLAQHQFNRRGQIIEDNDLLLDWHTLYTYHPNGQVRTITNLNGAGDIIYYAEYDPNGEFLS